VHHRRLLTALAVSTVVGLVAASPAQAADVRVAGNDRYETAAAVSRQFAGSQYAPVFLATGENFPDALAAAAAAGAEQSRVLLTGRYSVPESTLDELAARETTYVYLIGGTASVSTEVETGLERAGYTVLRLAGEDRYDTSATVAGILFDDPDTVFVATGENFPDALAGAAAAGSLGAPVLLVRPGSLPDSIRDALTEGFPQIRPSRFIVLGDERAVSNTVVDEIKALGYQSAAFERISGADRYATSVAVGRRFFPTAPSAVLAVGDNFPDALAAGPFAAATGAPLLLTQATTTPPATRADLDQRNPTDRYFIGAAQPN
jgi:putative cell wall-binding protein